MTNDQIQRYQPGGDIYARLEAERLAELQRGGEDLADLGENG